MAGRTPVIEAGAVRAVLCDLDDTLFDHSAATRHALAATAVAEPALARWTLDELAARHAVILEELHARVLAAELTVDMARLERFGRLLGDAGLRQPRDRAVEVATVYRSAYEAGWCLVDGAIDALAAFGRAGLPVVVVTNNGVVEQRLKLERTGLAPLVDALVTSEEVGAAKPRREIFEVALRRAGVGAEAAVMVGDSWPADVEGARGAGIRPVWFNRLGAPAPDAAVDVAADLPAVTTRVLAAAGVVPRR